MKEKVRVAVVGATGYGGVELVRFLLNHPKVELTSVVSSSSAGEPFANGYPHLEQIVTMDLAAIEPEKIREQAEVVFLATPHGVSTELAPKMLEADLTVVDLSGDFRINDQTTYEQWYGRKAPDAAYLEQAVYSLPELHGERVKDERFISNPGCFPTVVTLGIVPAVASGWIDANSLIIDAKTGVSGAGRGLSMTVHYSEVNENFYAYKVNKHQHTPEIEQVLTEVAGTAVQVTFTTHLVPMTRGIFATSYATINGKYSTQDFIDLYREYYNGKKFIRVRDEHQFPRTKEVWGSNFCDIGVSVDERTNRVTFLSVIDNLVKGASGQAIQNFNLMMGWDEDLGLYVPPMYP